MSVHAPRPPHETAVCADKHQMQAASVGDEPTVADELTRACNVYQSLKARWSREMYGRYIYIWLKVSFDQLSWVEIYCGNILPNSRYN